MLLMLSLNSWFEYAKETGQKSSLVNRLGTVAATMNLCYEMVNRLYAFQESVISSLIIFYINNIIINGKKTLNNREFAG